MRQIGIMRMLILLVAVLAGFTMHGQQMSTFVNVFNTSTVQGSVGHHDFSRRKLPRLQRPMTEDDRQMERLKELKSQKWEKDSERHDWQSRTAGIDPPIGINFRANETIDGTPPDNSIAISNAGIIISADNNSLDYFNDSGDSLLRVDLDTLLIDTTFSVSPFDPMVEYDFRTDRFYLVFVHGFQSAISKIALLISKSNDPRDGWWEYSFPAIDTVFNDSWTDYPVLAHNQEDIFVSAIMFEDASGNFEGNKVIKVDISSVLNGGIINYETYYNVKDGNGTVTRGIVPASLGQIGTLTNEIYFVSTINSGGNQFHLYHFHEGAITDTIESYSINIPEYSIPTDAGQLGNNQLLNTGDCKTRTAMYLNGKVHFAFGFDIDQGFSGINYNKVDVVTKVNTRDTWGLSGMFDYGYPSIASYGTDSMDESVMICFLRSGLTIYPQVCVVNYDGTWSANSKIVHMGQGPVDISVGNVERWGDRTGICRRFNGTSPGNWLAGHFGAGPATNQYGVDSSWSTWVAEIGDGRSIPNMQQIPIEEQKLLIYPNPSDGNFAITLYNYSGKKHHLEITDIAGRLMLRSLLPTQQDGMQFLEIGKASLFLPNGTYFVRVTESPMIHEKIVVVD